MGLCYFYIKECLLLMLVMVMVLLNMMETTTSATEMTGAKG